MVNAFEKSDFATAPIEIEVSGSEKNFPQQKILARSWKKQDRVGDRNAKRAFQNLEGGPLSLFHGFEV